MGYYFSIGPLSFILGGVLVHFQPKFDCRIYIVLAGVVNTFSLVLNGPSAMFQLPESIAIIIIA